jgi:hypothetical protein
MAHDWEFARETKWRFDQHKVDTTISDSVALTQVQGSAPRNLPNETISGRRTQLNAIVATNACQTIAEFDQAN